MFTDTPGVAAVAPGFNPGDYLSDDVLFESAEQDPFKYEFGKRLVRTEDDELNLSTMMWRMHKLYMDSSKSGQGSILVGSNADHEFLGEDYFYVEFDEFFQLYNQKALEKSLVACYCL